MKINVFVLICRTLGVLRPANWARLHGTFLRPGILESLNKITVGRFKAVHECFRLHCVIVHGFWLKTQQRCSGSRARTSDFLFFYFFLKRGFSGFCLQKRAFTVRPAWHTAFYLYSSALPLVAVGPHDVHNRPGVCTPSKARHQLQLPCRELTCRHPLTKRAVASQRLRRNTPP